MKRGQFDLWRSETEFLAPLMPEKGQRSKSISHENRLEKAFSKTIKNVKIKENERKQEKN